MRELGRTGQQLTPWGLWRDQDTGGAVADNATGPCNWCDVPLRLAGEDWVGIAAALQAERLHFVAVRVDGQDWGREMKERCRTFGERTEIQTIDLLQLGEFDLERIKAGEPFRRMQQVRDADLARRFGAYVTTLKEATWVIEHAPVAVLTVNGPLTDDEWAELTASAGEMEMGLLATARAFAGQREEAQRALQQWPITGIAWPA